VSGEHEPTYMPKELDAALLFASAVERATSMRPTLVEFPVSLADAQEVLMNRRPTGGGGTPSRELGFVGRTVWGSRLVYGSGTLV